MLPIAVISSILIALVLYIFLQVAFIGSVPTAQVAHGWSTINFRSPYVELLLIANLQIMVTMIYTGSVVSPGACGTAFLASSSRVLYSLAKQKNLPAFLGKLHPTYHSPRSSIIVCTIVGCLFLFLFKGWYNLVAIISVLHIFSYLAAPIVTIANRTKNKLIMAERDQFKLKGAYILAPILMFVLSVLLFYAAWPLTAEMLLLLLPGFAFYFYYDLKYFKDQKFSKTFKGASWLLFYIIGISFIVYIGDNPANGNTVSTVTSLILLAILSVLTYVYGAFFAVDKEKMKVLKED